MGFAVYQDGRPLDEREAVLALGVLIESAERAGMVVVRHDIDAEEGGYVPWIEYDREGILRNDPLVNRPMSREHRYIVERNIAADERRRRLLARLRGL